MTSTALLLPLTTGTDRRNHPRYSSLGGVRIVRPLAMQPEAIAAVLCDLSPVGARLEVWDDLLVGERVTLELMEEGHVICLLAAEVQWVEAIDDERLSIGSRLIVELTRRQLSRLTSFLVR